LRDARQNLRIRASIAAGRKAVSSSLWTGRGNRKLNNSTEFSLKIDSYARDKERHCPQSLAHDARTCLESTTKCSVVEGSIADLGQDRGIQTLVSGRCERQSSYWDS